MKLGGDSFNREGATGSRMPRVILASFGKEEKKLPLPPPPRVARWFDFKPKIPKLGKFWRAFER
jgi:hypothetical protein